MINKIQLFCKNQSTFAFERLIGIDFFQVSVVLCKHNQSLFGVLYSVAYLPEL
jgi:hypothetical protein